VRRRRLYATVTAILIGVAAGVTAVTAPQQTVRTPRYSCADLPDQDFSQVKGAPTTILAASLRTAANAAGEHLYTGGEPYGAEAAWPGIVIPATTGAGAEDTTFFHSIGIGYLRWVGLWTDDLSLDLDKGFQFNLSTFRQYAAHGSSANLSSVVDATDPNLTAFYRLYMFPGVYHCGGGYGPDVFDLLTPLVTWVENGTAPADVVAAAVSGGTGAAGTGASAGTVEYTRPVYPYPEEVKYSGAGNVNDASSYVGYLPSTPRNDNYQWAGAPFTSGYEEWCALKNDDTALVCSRRKGS
jgi:feruloyl esterase